MALDAVDAGVGALAVCDQFGVHGLVADLAAELYGFRVVVGLVAAEGREKKEESGAAAEDVEMAALLRIVQVELPPIGSLACVAERVSPLQPGADEDDRESRDQECG